MADLRALEGETPEAGGSKLLRRDTLGQRSAHAMANLLSNSALAVVLLLLWQLATAVFQINPYILPSPIVILNTLVSSLDFLVGHMLATLQETLLGFILAGVIGVGLAMLLSHFRWLRESSYPILMFIQTMPKVALAPVLLVWFGYGLMPKLAMTFLSAFFPILINSMAGLTAIDEELLYLTRVLGATPVQVYRKVRLANALPYIFAGLKVGITLAVECSGGYPTNTAGGRTSLAKVALASGIPYAAEVTSLEEFAETYRGALARAGSHVIVAKVEFNPSYPKGCPIPSAAMDPVEYSLQFARCVEEAEGICVRKNPRDVFP